MKELSPILRELPVSAATAVDMLVRQRRAAGHNVLSFCVGEPDFPSVPAAVRAGHEAITAGHTRYTAPAGTAELKSAVAFAMARDYGLSYAADEIAVTPGAKYAVDAAVAAVTAPGDELLIPTPAWPSFGPIVRLHGGEPVFIPCTAETGFRLTPAALEAACSPRSKALILNNPCNPSGVLYSAAELAGLMEVCRRHDLYVICDEVYARLVYDGMPFTSCAALGEDARQRCIVVNGVSKAYAMTGWRIGWACGKSDIIKLISIYVNHTSGNPCTISQEAAEAALLGEQGDTEEMRRIYEERRNVLVPELRRLGLPCEMPGGAFYVMADVRSCCISRDFAFKLLEEENVAVVPCDDYGAPGYVRLAYTLPEEQIREGLLRLERFLERNRNK